MALRTPLYDRHLALGASMVEFGGYEMPLQYRGIREEHVAVRERAGLFDLSHMGEVAIGGRNAQNAVQRLVANDVSRLTTRGRALYAVMCNDEGGIVDDVVVYRGLGEEETYLVVVNAATRSSDVSWMESRLLPGAGLRDVSDATALVAVQGPRALGIVQDVCDEELGALRPFSATAARVAGIDPRACVVSRTGYTGEDGVEVYVDAEHAGTLWDALIEAGAERGLIPCGLGARDTLRLEAGLRLYGQDMDDTIDPYTAGLGWTVRLDAGDFIGAGALRMIRERGPKRRTIGLRLEGRAIARHGMAVDDGGRRAGEVTSGGHSFTLGVGIAIARVDAAVAARRGEGETLQVDIRGRRTPATVVALPFYRRKPQTPEPQPPRGE